MAAIPDAGARVLDIGCKDGALRRHLPPSVEYWGLEIAPVFARENVKLNKADYGWTTHGRSGCTGSWNVRAAATHEFGHVFGLAHVSALLHPHQTMSPFVLPCQSSQSTLGRGDVLGLRTLY